MLPPDNLFDDMLPHEEDAFEFEEDVSSNGRIAVDGCTVYDHWMQLITLRRKTLDNAVSRYKSMCLKPHGERDHWWFLGVQKASLLRNTSVGIRHRCTKTKEARQLSISIAKLVAILAHLSSPSEMAQALSGTLLAY
jgi:hypothetical protein